MKKNTIPMIYKWLCTLLVAISILLTCTGGITIADRDTRRSVKKEMKSLLKEMDVSNKDIKELQEELDNWNIDINAKKLVKQIQSFAGVITDAKISTFELAVNGPSVISLAEEVEDYARIGALFSDIPSSVVDGIDDAKAGIWYGIVLFYLTAIIGIITVILHIANKKSPGVIFTILQLIWLITLGIVAHEINVIAEDELYLDEKLVAITGGSIWAFILALVACLLWVFKDSILGMIGKITGVDYAPTVSAESGNICPNCGKVLGANALFCTGCGTKFTAPEPKVEPDTPEKSKGDDSLFCPNCGASVTSDSDFCTQCGTKLN